jgi:hypothetical protein
MIHILSLNAWCGSAFPPKYTLNSDEIDQRPTCPQLD